MSVSTADFSSVTTSIQKLKKQKPISKPINYNSLSLSKRAK